MSADEPTAEDEQLLALFAAGEAALASDQSAETITNADAPPKVRVRLQRDLACAQLLRRALGRPAVDVAAAPGLPWTHLGRFEIRRELGKGGFGIVYLAYDPVLGRELALKVPRVEVAVTPELRERFGREARAAAGLEHPNIVPVYEAGEVGPVCYIASAYCPGITLGQWLKDCRNPVPFATAAELLATLAEAMEHAHQRGVIHRDLKPGNILLQSVAHQPEALARDLHSLANASGWCATDYGLPKITDFGLAKLMTGGRDGDQTHSWAILGTASYMAPEQAGGKTRSAGPAADIHALGAILYEVLTGRPPFRGETYLDTLQQVQEEEPVPPARLRPKTPRDLETICLKCLQKEPACRYASAAALAEDLRRFLRGEPIQARPVSRAERLWRWCRRSPAVASLIAAVGISLLGGTGVATYYALRAEANARQARTHAEQAKANARIVSEQAEESLADAASEVSQVQERSTEHQKELRQQERIVTGIQAQVVEARKRRDTQRHLAEIANSTSKEEVRGAELAFQGAEALERAEKARLEALRLDDPLLEIEVARSRLAVSQARVAQARLFTEPQTTPNDTDEFARLRVTEAEAVVQLAVNRLKRAERLVVVHECQVTAQSASIEAVEARLADAQERWRIQRLLFSRSPPATRQEEVNAAKAAVRQFEAAKEAEKARLAKLLVRDVVAQRKKAEARVPIARARLAEAQKALGSPP
jgi:serine/threonine protein kinase